MTGVEVIALGVMIMILLPIVITDLQEQRIPNLWNGALAAGGFAAQLARRPELSTVIQCLVAMAATAATFLALIWTMKALKRQGTLGLGDVKFLIAASLWVGFIGAAMVFLVAAIASLIWALALSPWRGLDLKRPMAFAPFLAGGLTAVFLLAALLA